MVLLLLLLPPPLPQCCLHMNARELQRYTVYTRRFKPKLPVVIRERVHWPLTLPRRITLQQDAVTEYFRSPHVRFRRFQHRTCLLLLLLCGRTRLASLTLRRFLACTHKRAVLNGFVPLL